MGQVIAPFGVQGWLRLRVYTETADALAEYADWWIERSGQWAPYTVESAAVGTKGLRAKLREIPDRTVAEAFRGARIAVSRADLPKLENEFYWSDLVGLEVRNARDERLGVVSSLMEGAQSVLVVAGERERLIPAPMITAVDLQGRLIRVDWELEY